MVGNTNISGKFAAMQMDKQPAHCLADELVSFELTPLHFITFS